MTTITRPYKNGIDEAAASAKAQKERTMLIGFTIGVLTLFPFAIITFYSKSLVMFTELLRSASESLMILISYLLIRWADKRQKSMLQAEKTSAAVAAAVMLLSFFIILFNGWQRLIHPVQMNFNGLIWGVFAAIFSASINSYLWKRNYTVARLENSPAMEAQWRVFRAKALINFSVLLTMLANIIFFTNPSIAYVDISVSFLLSLVVLYTAFSNAKIAFQKQEIQL